MSINDRDDDTAETAVLAEPARPVAVRRRPATTVWQFVAFVLIVLLGGAAFIAVTPPGQNSDEQAHVVRAWQIAHGGLVATKTHDVPGVRNGLAGGMIPVQLNELFSTAQVTRGFDETALFRDLDWRKIAAYHDDGKREWTTFVNTAQYPPVAYVPQVVAVWVADAFHLPFLVMVELGRVFGLLAGAALFVLAALLARSARLAVFAVGLLPSVIGQSAAFSADGVTIALSTLATVLVFRWAVRPAPLRWPRWVTLLLVFVALALVKPTYAPIAVLVLVIPVVNVYARRLWPILVSVSLVIATAVVTLLWLRATSWVAIGVNGSNDPAVQQSYVLHHPLAFVKAFVKGIVLDGYTGLTDQKGEVWRGVFGDFAWLRAPLPMVFVLMLAVGLVLSMLVIEPRERFAVSVLRRGVLWRVVTAATVGIVLVAVGAALYIYFTPTRGQVLEGVQGRYFLPVLLAFMLLFVGNRVLRQRAVWFYVFGASAVSVVASIVVIDQRFYATILPHLG